MKKTLRNLVLLGIGVLFIGCGAPQAQANEAENITSVMPTCTSIPAQTNTSTPTMMPTNTPTPAPSAIDFAIEAYNKGNYSDALKELEDVQYSQKKEYLINIADAYFDQGSMESAYEVATIIDQYDEATAKGIYEKIKYRWFCYDPYEMVYNDEVVYVDSYDHYTENGIDVMCEFYGTWYDRNSGEMIEITEYTIDGKPYGVEAIYDDNGIQVVIYHYLDMPYDTYGMGLDFEYFEITDIDSMYINKLYDASYFAPWELNVSDLSAYDVTKEKYEYISELSYGHVYGDNHPTSSSSSSKKSAVYEAAKKEFKNSWINKRYDMVEQVYLYTEYDSVNEATYFYNESMGTHQIRFEVSLSENFCLTNETYVINAEFYEQNGQLKISMFNVY